MSLRILNYSYTCTISATDIQFTIIMIMSLLLFIYLFIYWFVKVTYDTSPMSRAGPISDRVVNPVALQENIKIILKQTQKVANDQYSKS